jgi:DNA-binding GntR family transcriptional regulator
VIKIKLHAKLNVILHLKFMDDFLNVLTISKPKNTAEHVYLEIKKMLFNYQIVPGQKLQCQDLAEKFKVSRTPVKDALNMMEKEGYVELKHNKGYYVAEIGLKEAEELYDIREALEVLGVQRAIENLNQRSLGILKEAMEAYSKDLMMPLTRKRLILDANFHLRMMQLSQNIALVATLRMIFSKIYLKHKIENLSIQRGNQADKEHKQIYEAICSGKTSSAIEIVRRHIAMSRKNILGYLVEGK